MTVVPARVNHRRVQVSGKAASIQKKEIIHTEVVPGRMVIGIKGRAEIGHCQETDVIDGIIEEAVPIHGQTDNEAAAMIDQ